MPNSGVIGNNLRGTSADPLPIPICDGVYPSSPPQLVARPRQVDQEGGWEDKCKEERAYIQVRTGGGGGSRKWSL
jgi:hypothetical protein